jgi:hypothetical protein
MLRAARSASTAAKVVRHRGVHVNQHCSRHLSQNSRDHAFSLLGLKSFSEAEIETSFNRLQAAPTEQRDERDVGLKSNTASVDILKGIQHLADTEYPIKLDAKAVKKVTELVVGKKADSTHTTMSLAQYKTSVRALGERLDPRVWNIGLSFLFTGKHTYYVAGACWVLKWTPIAGCLLFHHSSFSAVSSISIQHHYLPFLADTIPLSHHRHQCRYHHPVHAPAGLAASHPSL